MLRTMAERKRSKLTIEGDRAAAAAKRKLLLKTLKACGWNLADTARALDMGTAGNVSAAITELELTAEHAAAKAAGKIRVGRPRSY